MVDAKGRPYFLWDQEMTLDECRCAIRSEPIEVRAWLIGKMMREAKPDDVFEFVTLVEIADTWPALQPHLGRSSCKPARGLAPWYRAWGSPGSKSPTVAPVPDRPPSRWEQLRADPSGNEQAGGSSETPVEQGRGCGGSRAC
jgi:hypothetical protein